MRDLTEFGVRAKGVELNPEALPVDPFEAEARKEMVRQALISETSGDKYTDAKVIAIIFAIICSLIAFVFWYGYQ